MKNIAIICKKDRPEPDEILRGFVPWLRKKGMSVLMLRGMQEPPSIEGLTICTEDEIQKRADLAIVLGGDGTMLGAARLLAHKGTPILGINLGELGFITEVASNEIFSAVECALEGKCSIEQRTMLSLTMPNGESSIARNALNDVLVTRGSTPRIISLEVSVNGTFVNTFKADGIVVATPTGSTAYSLSADGPILFPTVDSIVMTPVCPHTLTNRPIVLPDDVEISITLKTADEATVMHDGLMAATIKQEQTVIIKKSPDKANLIMPESRDHFSVLRGKLGWGRR